VCLRERKRERKREIENRSLEKNFEMSSKRNVIEELFRQEAKLKIEDCKMVLAPHAQNVHDYCDFNPPPFLSHLSEQSAANVTNFLSR